MTTHSKYGTPQRNSIVMGEHALAMFRQMVANGQEKLTPESIKAMRELENEIALARKPAGVK